MQAPLTSGSEVISDESASKENKFLTPRGLVWPFNRRKWRQVGYTHTQTHTMALTSPSTRLISSLTNPQTHTMCAKTFLLLHEANIVFKRVKSPWNMTLCADLFLPNAVNTQTEENRVHLRQNCSSGTIQVLLKDYLTNILLLSLQLFFTP